MEDTGECFICLCGDEEVGKGKQIVVTMENCGCSPRVHSQCLVEWYTGVGANGRDICPVCRTSGEIRGIAGIIEQTVEQTVEQTEPPEQTETLEQTVPQYENTYQPIQDQEPAQVANNGDTQMDAQKRVAYVFIFLICSLLLVYAFLNIEGTWD